MHHYGVAPQGHFLRGAALEKGTTLVCGLRLVLVHLAGSEPINTRLLEY